MYALIQNNVVVEYPLSVNAWRNAHHNISLPLTPTEQQLNEVGIFNVASVQQPSFNPLTHKVVESTPVFNNG